MSVRASAVAVGDRADPELQRRPVGHEFRDVLADPPLHIPDPRAAMGVRRHVDLNRQVDVADMDEALPERSRHRPSNCTTTVFAESIAACIASTLVPSEQNPWASGGVALTKTTSSGSAPDSEQARDVRQEHGNVVRPALVDGGAGIRPDEQGAMPEVTLHLGRQVRPGPFQWRWTTVTSWRSGARATRASSSTDGVAAAQWRYTPVAGPHDVRGFRGGDDSHAGRLRAHSPAARGGTNRGGASIRHRGRPAEQIALAQSDADRSERVALGDRLDAFGDERTARLEREIDETGDEGLSGIVAVDRPDEVDVELHELGLQLDDVAEAREPGARSSIAKRTPGPRARIASRRPS